MDYREHDVMDSSTSGKKSWLSRISMKQAAEPQNIQESIRDVHKEVSKLHLDGSCNTRAIMLQDDRFS